MLLLYVDELFLIGKEELIKFSRRGSLLSMEVWQNAHEISLGQGKYEVEILKRFRMMECKAMTKTMESNLKLLSDASSESVDAMMYHQIICSLMYLTNMRPDICFAVNTMSQFLIDFYKANSEVPKEYT